MKVQITVVSQAPVAVGQLASVRPVRTSHMISRQSDRVVKRGSFLYDGLVRCIVEIVQTHFRPGLDDDEAQEEDAYDEFYEVRYSSPGPQGYGAGGGYYDSLAGAVRAVGSKVREIQWED